MIVDVDARRRIRTARTTALVMLGITVAGFLDAGVAFVILTINAAIWLGWALDKTGQLRELELADDSQLHKEVRRMKQ